MTDCPASRAGLRARGFPEPEDNGQDHRAEDDEDNLDILDTQQLAETLSGTTQVMTTLLGAVAALSLLVGGIGIMNIMPAINVLSFVFSAAIGVLFGHFPAKRAAKLDPIDALRHE